MKKNIPMHLFLFLFLLSGCAHSLTIHEPADGSIFVEGSTIHLEAEIRGGESGCGGEDCNCAHWWWTSEASDLGLDKSNGTEVSYCRYTWELPASTLGVGNHRVTIHADQTNYRETRESIGIIIQP
ncbi:MAG: hypothetical protein OEV42_10355 [Deltaproteobacteria bacterium]|nr:hypothetical protein [Deltaproteobacteria bacterium]